MQAVLRLHGFLNSTIYFGTLICPFSTKSLLRLPGLVLTRFFFQSKAEDLLYKVVFNVNFIFFKPLPESDTFKDLELSQRSTICSRYVDSY